MDEDANGQVSVEEWNSFWSERGVQWGQGKLRKVVASLVYEADVDVKDLCESAVERSSDLDAKHQIAQAVGPGGWAECGSQARDR